MSDEEKKHTEESSDSSIYYILGGVVLVAAIAGFFLLKPKEATMAPTPSTETPSQEVVAVSPTPAPITKFACEKQYFNPMVGLPKFYLSAEGVDILTTGDVTCDYSISVGNKVVATATATGTLINDPARGGGTFRCQTNPALELARGVNTKVDVTVTNPNSETATCTQNFVFP